MPPKKRSAPTTRSQSKRPRASELTEETAESVTATPPPNLMTVDVQALSATISLAVTQAVQQALGQVKAPTPVTKEVVEASVQDEVSLLTEGTATNSKFTAQPLSLPANREPFASIAVALRSSVSPKLKAKIWAKEFIEFGSLLTSSANQDRYSVCLTPSSNSSSQPRLTLEPCQPSKKIHNFLQWLSAFNIFVAIFSEKFPNETPRLMKYSEIIRDISTKPGDWYLYDEQFRYIRQSAPDQYPWDTIHWELWIKVVINFRPNPRNLSRIWRLHAPGLASPFPKGPAGPFTPENTVVVANSNIFASNVVPSTQPANAPPLINSVPLSPRMAQVLHSRPVTPVKVDRLEYLLHGYPASLQRYLVSGFSCGFHIHFMGERHAFESPNLKSALEQPQIVVSKLNKERDAGRIVGPFSEPPFHKFRCSPLSIVPKKDPSEFRLIHHLSYPPGSSVNDFIPEDCSSVHYASINDAISVIKRKGAGCFMAKTDAKSAFRIIPIHPNDFALLGMKWQNSYYFDRCLPMGCSSSCAIFEAFSTALEWLAINRLGDSGVLHILDDFLFIADSQDKCHADLTNFLGMCEYLGVPIAQEKTVGPDTTLQFAGITLDSVMQEARLPVDKLRKCRMLLRTFYKRRKVTLRELQSLLGLLNFTCSVIVPGRAFLRRMIDLTKGAKRPYHRIRLSKEVRHGHLAYIFG